MKTLERGRDKIKMLSEALRRETLEPAEAECKALLAEARAESERMIDEAKRKVAELETAARTRIEKERAVFHSSLGQACRQSLESLRQSIQAELFNKQLASEVAAASSEPELIARLISVLVQALESEGIGVDLAVVLPQHAEPREVNRFLLARVLQRIGKEGISVGDFEGGVRIKLIDNKLTFDMSNQALEELFAQFLRKDYRSMLFERPAAS